MLRKVTKRIVILTVSIVVVLMMLLIAHIFQIRVAKDHFDIVHLDREITWIKKNAPWFDRIPLIRDSDIWLSLNQGKVLPDREILANSDDKHLFWLVQFKLQKGQYTEASEILNKIVSPSEQMLGMGLLDLAQGRYDSALQKLNAAQDTKLTKEENVLKLLALSRRLMVLGENVSAQEEWEKAKNIAPNHPLIVAAEFDLALLRGDWKNAEELLPQIDQWPGYDQDFEFQTKKGLLYLTLGQKEEWDEVLTHLNQLPEGKPYGSYLAGIKKYREGDWKTAKVNLQDSLTTQLSPLIQQDARMALQQVDERLSADKALQKLK